MKTGKSMIIGGLLLILLFVAGGAVLLAQNGNGDENFDLQNPPAVSAVQAIETVLTANPDTFVIALKLELEGDTEQQVGEQNEGGSDQEAGEVNEGGSAQEVSGETEGAEPQITGLVYDITLNTHQEVYVDATSGAIVATIAHLDTDQEGESVEDDD